MLYSCSLFAVLRVFVVSYTYGRWSSFEMYKWFSGWLFL